MTSDGNQNRRIPLAIGIAIIVLLAFAVYSPVLPGSFLMDDARLTGHDNALVSGQASPLSIWFQTDFPLAAVGWWLEHLAFGSNPAGYHVVNILLHALSALLLWRLLAQLKIPGAWLAGALYAVHPVCVNSVARIAELKNTLSMPFFLLSFIGYLHYEAIALYPAESDNAKPTCSKATLWLTISLVAFVLALFAKTTIAMLPVVLLLCALWQRRRIAWKDVLHTTPFFVLAIAFGLMSVWFQKHQALTSTQLVLQPTSFAQRLAGAGCDFWFYLSKALFPLNLCIQYPRWKMDTGMAAWLPDLLACGLFIICLIFWRTWGRHAFFGLTVFAVMLFPALGFFDAQYLTMWDVSDHLQYSALAAIVALAAAALAAWLQCQIFQGTMAVLLLACSAICFVHAEAFRTQESLMRDTLAKNPRSADAHNELGFVLVTQYNDFAQAAQEFQTAVECDPNSADARVNYGHALMLAGKFPGAEAQFQAALKIEPYDPPAHSTYAQLLERERRNAEAFYHLQMVVLFEPNFERCLQTAVLEYQTGHPREAVAYFRKALAFKADPEVLNNLAWILATCPDDSVRNGSEAVRDAEQACDLTAYKRPGMIGTLAAAYAEAGHFPEAISTAQTAINLASDAGNAQFANQNRQLLELYRAGKSYREQSPIGGGRQP